MLFENSETSVISPFTFGMSVCIFLARKEAFVIIFLAITGVEACWLDDVEIWLGLEFEARFLMALLSSNTSVDPDNEALMWIISTIRLVSSWKRSKWILSMCHSFYLRSTHCFAQIHRFFFFLKFKALNESWTICINIT